MNEIEVSDSDLRRLEQLSRRSTPGPWISHIEGRDHTSGSDFIKTGGEDLEISGASEFDYDFIALCREMAPLMIAEIIKFRADSD